MNRNNFPNYSYYQQTPQTFPTANPNPSWNGWSVEAQQQYSNYQRNSAQYPSAAPTNTNTRLDPRTQNYYNATATNRYYQQESSARYNAGSTNGQYTSGSNQNWPRNNYYNNKRHLSESSESYETKSKPNKKKKKPLSQNKPSKKDWTIEEAKKALDMEKDFNKRAKNQSLIIKFPDLELSRDIVSNFHPAIENVHFQQPSMARYCFVTLQGSAEADDVIQDLNKTKFGQGFLTAEYKKDREEDHNVGPEDIDPLTLYVGNLAQEVTKEDVVKSYPKQRRIDIGYAKKMKYTRYAFVSFKNIEDSLEAFQRTHSTQMYSKSLIVRFRRLRGPVGMPGEAKPQNEPRNWDDGNLSDEGLPPHNILTPSPSEHSSRVTDISSTDVAVDNVETNDSFNAETPPPPPAVVNLDLVKKEPNSDDEMEEKLFRTEKYQSPFSPGCIDAVFAKHRPKVKQEVKKEVKKEEPLTSTSWSGSTSSEVQKKCKLPPESPSSQTIKSEFIGPDIVKKEVEKDDDKESSEDDDAEGDDDDNLDSLLDNLEDRARKIRSLQSILH